MGKTTLVNCITGHLPVASGSMTWHDIGSPPCDITPLSAHSRSIIGIGYVPQDRRIFSQLSVEENLHIALAAGGNPGGAVKGRFTIFSRSSTHDVSIKPRCCQKMTSTSWRWRERWLSGRVC
jgi:ABC-type branched-subunit amino acid transport system ATPase component